MVDVIREIQTTLRTGRVILGYRRTLKAVVNGKAKLVVIAKNAPENVMSDLLTYSKLARIPIYIFSGTSRDLGAICNKPFTVSAMAIIDPGESNVLDLTKGE